MFKKSDETSWKMKLWRMSKTIEQSDEHEVAVDARKHFFRERISRNISELE